MRRHPAVRGGILAVLIAAAAAAGGCVQRIEPPPAGEPEPQIFLDIEEAELIALYLGDGVRLDRFLMKRVFYDLSLIRGAFRDLVEAVDYITFRPPCTSDAVAVRFENAAYTRAATGSYDPWRELNDLYGPVSRQNESDLRTVILYFDGRYDYRALAAEYAELPGVIEAICVMPIGDSPNIYARRTTAGITYLFRDAWGECAAGCEYNEFYYFICESDDAVYVGSWNPDGPGDPPRWWSEARLNLPPGLIERFR